MDPYNSVGEGILASAIVLLVITVITICLRFYSRQFIVGGLAVDDWLMLVATLFVVSGIVISIFLVKLGYGFHVEEIYLTHPENLIPIYKLLFVDEFIYAFSNFATKSSMIAFFLTFLPRDTKTRKMCWYLLGLITILLIVDVVLALVECIPFEKRWDFFLPGTCLNLEAWFYAAAATNIITDTFVVLLPMKWLFRVQTKRFDKNLLIAVFAVAGLAPVAGVVRLYTIVIATESLDFTYNDHLLLIFSGIELTIGICCGSAPAIKPLLFRKNRDARAQRPEAKSVSSSVPSSSVSTQPYDKSGSNASQLQEMSSALGNISDEDFFRTV